jgi:HEAT repeat protein
MKSLSPKTFALVIVYFLTTCVLPAFSQTKSKEAWEILETNLSAKETRKRALAVHVLGLLPGDSKALKLVQNATVDEKADVRTAAASALGQIHSRSSVPLLQKLLSDNDPSVALSAASALVTFRDPAAYEVYYEFLVGDRKTGKGVIAENLKMLKDPKKMAQLGVEEGIGFIPFAGIGLSAFKTLHVDDVSPVRAAAAKMLANDPDPDSGQALVNATSDKSWIVKTAALEAIAKRGDPQLLDGILPAMNDENNSVRFTAAAAVIHLSTLATAKTSREAKEKKAGSTGTGPIGK